MQPETIVKKYLGKVFVVFSRSFTLPVWVARTRYNKCFSSVITVVLIHINWFVCFSKERNSTYVFETLELELVKCFSSPYCWSPSDDSSLSRYVVGLDTLSPTEVRCDAVISWV